MKRTKTKTIIALVVVLVFAIIVTYVLLKSKRYDIASFLIALLGIAAFVLNLESGLANNTRLLVIVAEMTALSVAGRLVFSPIPFFKPITALIVISALYLGSRSGFIIGSLSALLSNLYFGQGAWTPFQMIIFGLIGFLSGVLARHIQRNRITLAMWGIISGAVYSTFMDIWTTLWVDGNFNLARYLFFIISSLPIMLVYAISNVIFLLLLTRPIGRKITRLKEKFGI